MKERWRNKSNIWNRRLRIRKRCENIKCKLKSSFKKQWRLKLFCAETRETVLSHTPRANQSDRSSSLAQALETIWHPTLPISLHHWALLNVTFMVVDRVKRGWQHHQKWDTLLAPSECKIKVSRVNKANESDYHTSQADVEQETQSQKNPRFPTTKVNFMLYQLKLQAIKNHFLKVNLTEAESEHRIQEGLEIEYNKIIR